MQQVVLSGRQQWTRVIKFENNFFFKFNSNFVLLFPSPASSPQPPQGSALSLKKAEFSDGDIGDFSPGRNLRTTKTPQAEISGRKLLRPKPLESVPQFFRPSLSNKAGWAFTVNCSGIIAYIVCSLFDVRIISVYVYMQPVIFIRKVAPISKPLNDLSRSLHTDF